MLQYTIVWYRFLASLGMTVRRDGGTMFDTLHRSVDGVAAQRYNQAT
jgi:hypothetical protein